ncbi:Golgi-associated plant pathogenesis-related protein 1 [Folsomia candida]|uniref:Golgi-associated plant pathogenesis-related protein 1 n=1 Tax=Folsomia candida TaxID=158441 RepID=A0A226ELJ2_FOLCA|nr:Golgi-associated plant pathogenesis-related protein 1 [Folsomia candida]
MVDKKVVSSSTQKSTKTSTEPDGTIIETITTTITEKYSDGSSGVKTKVETITKPSTKCPSCAGGAQAPTHSSPAHSTAPKVENTTDPTFIQEALEEHNVLRAKHGAPPLILNADLGKISQAWVNNLAKLGKMQHNSTCGFGENVYWNTEKVDGKRPVSQWYSEIKEKLEPQPGTGTNLNFTNQTIICVFIN